MNIKLALLLLTTVVSLRAAIPWDIRSLSHPPKMHDTESTEPGVRALFFDSVPHRGKPTQVFAYYGAPAGRKVPAMVLVHGGGGTAFAEWVRMWNRRGYAAIAIDTVGTVPGRAEDGKLWSPPRKRHQHAGPPGWGGFDNIDEPAADQWTYHAVAAAILAHSLIRSFPEVDPERVGVTGISWGGFLTSIVSGLDPRFRFAAPVYGCGFLGEDSAWLKQFANLGPERAARWLSLWDPSAYLPASKIPMLWVTGSNDFAYPFPSLQKSYRLPAGPRTLSIRVGMKHSHSDGASPEEIAAFADALFRKGKPLPRIVNASRGSVEYAAGTRIVRAELNYTRQAGRWQDRKWDTVPARLDGQQRKATAKPPEDATAWYFNLFDGRGLVASSEHLVSAKNEEHPATLPEPSTATFQAWMDSIAQEQLAARRRSVASIRDRAAAEHRQAELRTKYLELIGGLPDYKGPLNARKTGEIDAGSHIVEKVLYESFPRYFVTGNVYRPKAPGRYPAILFSLGHWSEGKAAAQTIAANLAMNGFVVLAYDPVGQGERLQAYDPKFGVTLGATDQHFMAGVQALMAGRALASYMIFDAQRSLDYLQSRPDVDSERIGASGCSGGGTITTLLAAMDPRIKVAAPACYITSFELLFSGSIGDSEQSPPGLLSSGMDQPDFIAMFAPKPWLIASTREDFFPLEGARRAFEEASKWYELFGAPERISWVVGPGGHGTPLEVREAIYAWMTRWLKDSPGPVKEQLARTFPEHELWAAPQGQVGLLEESRDLWEVIRSEYKPRGSRNVSELLSPLDRPAPLRVISRESEPKYGREDLAITVEKGLEISATLLTPSTAQTETAVVVIEPGPGVSELSLEFVEAGAVVLALRPHGLAEPDPRRPLLGDWITNTRAWLIGRNLPVMRAQGVLAAVALLAARQDVKRIAGVGRGVPGIWMLMAAAVEPRLARVWIDGAPHSFRSTLDGPVHRHAHEALIPGARWDLPDLIAALGQEKVIWTDPTNWVSKVPLPGPYIYRRFEEKNGRFIDRLLAP